MHNNRPRPPALVFDYRLLDKTDDDHEDGAANHATDQADDQTDDPVHGLSFRSSRSRHCLNSWNIGMKRQRTLASPLLPVTSTIICDYKLFQN
jgi:hypothetical protein